MTKTLRVSLLLVLTAACGGPSDGVPSSDPIRYRSTFDGSTRGVVLHADGEEGHAGMFGTNCPFETRTGTVTGDYDLPDEDEDVQDAETTALGEITLTATIPDTVHVLDKTDGIYTHVPLPIPGVREGRLTRDGVVGLTSDCRLHWVGFDGTTRGERALPTCSGELEVDPDSGATAVADPQETVIVTPGSDAPRASDADGDLVAWDDVAEVFYVATTGGTALAAVERDGSARWTTETPGLVRALDDGGVTGTAAVVLELADGRGAVAFYDGRTGDRVRFATTPSTAEDLAVSGDGRIVALVRPEQTFFYELDPAD